MSMPWNPISSAPEDIVVETKIDDQHGERNIQTLKRRGNLWWAPDGSMYVYYTPTHWRFVESSPKSLVNSGANSGDTNHQRNMREIIRDTDEDVLVGLVMTLTSGWANPATVSANIKRIRDGQ